MFKSFIAILKWWAVGANFQMLVLTGNRCFKRNFFGLKAESHSRWVLHPVIFLMVSLSPTHICLLCSSDFFFFFGILQVFTTIYTWEQDLHLSLTGWKKWVSRVGEPNAIHLSGKDLCPSRLPLLCISVSWKDITMIRVSFFLLSGYFFWQGEVI